MSHLLLLIANAVFITLLNPDICLSRDNLPTLYCSDEQGINREFKESDAGLVARLGPACGPRDVGLEEKGRAILRTDLAQRKVTIGS